MKLHENTLSRDEEIAAVDVLRSTMVTQGEKVKEFEQAFRPGSVACNSGSSANLLAISALKALEILKDGDEVVVPALCWSTTVFPLIQHGLVPVFVDCDIDTLNIDPEEIYISKIGIPAAIMLVHVYGNPCDMDEFPDSMTLIEDCCEAMGAVYQNHPVGSFGDVSTFSTYFSHHITTMEGGIVVSPFSQTTGMLRIQRSHGWGKDHFEFVELGYNLRMTEVQAAIGIVQLRKLPDILHKRREVWTKLNELFKDYPWLRTQTITPGGESSYFGFTMIVEDDSPVSPGRITSRLNNYGIETRPIIAGNMALQPVMLKHPHRCVGNLPNATKVMNSGFSIGCHQGVTDNDIDKLSEAMKTLK